MPIDFRDIEAEILAGLANERRRLDSALFNLEFFAADFSRWPYRAEDTPFGMKRFERTAPVMRRIVEVLSEDLYRAPPVRSVVGDDAATEWLETVYADNNADAVWQRADEMTAVGDFAAIQVAATGDPARPVEFTLWDASELVVWTDPDRRTRPAAVAVIDRADNQRRLRLWTPEYLAEYRTARLKPGQTADGTMFRPVGSPEANPYAPLLPFAFAHYHFPVCEFDEGGPGDGLRQANDYINFRLTESGDNMRYFGRPIAVAEGVNPGWRPPTLPKPGEWIDLPPSAIAASGQGPRPNLRYIQADLNIINLEWTDINGFLDTTLEMHGVPPGAVRLDVRSGPNSGVQVIAERAPLLGRAVKRRKPFGVYERELARITLAIGGRWLNRPDLVAASAQGIALRWPPLDDSLPGPERDRQDDWRLAKGFVSRVMLLMEREGLTREQAEARLEQVSEDKALEGELGIGVSPIGAEAGDGGGGGNAPSGKATKPGSPDAEDDDEGEDDDE